MLKNLRKKLFEATSIYSLVFTRISLGCLITYEGFRYIFSKQDWIYWYFVKPRFHFKYYGFDWIEPLPGNCMYWLFYALTFSGFLIAIGAFYRIAIIFFTLGFTYIFLIDQVRYLNHFYMLILFCTLMCFMPAHRYCSVDAYLRPKIKTNVIDFWPIFLLRTQMEIILIFAGIVKINYDWLHFMPLKYWLADGNKISFLDYLFHQPWAAAVASYGTIILHVAGAPLLLWKPSRIYVFVIYCIFHIANSLTFNIGIFPWMTIAFTLIFFAPNWPAKILKLPQNPQDKIFHQAEISKQKLIIWLMAIWIFIQVFLPLRNLFYSGYVLWNHEGHDFSWRMKIQDVAGESSFLITDKNSAEQRNIIYGEKDTLHCHPDMILEFAHHLRDSAKEYGRDVMVHAHSSCSLNRRSQQVFVNPNIDLAKEKRGFAPYKWIMPFDPRTR